MLFRIHRDENGLMKSDDLLHRPVDGDIMLIPCALDIVITGQDWVQTLNHEEDFFRHGDSRCGLEKTKWEVCSAA